MLNFPTLAQNHERRRQRALRIFRFLFFVGNRKKTKKKISFSIFFSKSIFGAQFH